MKALAGRFAIIRIITEVQLLLKKLDCGGSLLQQVIEIERLVDHGQLSVGVSRPIFWRPVTIEFKAATIRVAKIQRFGNAMVRSSIKRNASVQKSTQRIGQCRTRWIKDCEVVEPRRSARRRCTAAALPRSMQCDDDIRPRIRMPPQRPNAQ
jgi:hypothetical protein